MLPSLMRRVLLGTQHTHKLLYIDSNQYIFNSNFYNSSCYFSNNTGKEKSNENQAKSKSVKQSPIITLLGIEGGQSVVTLEEATKIAKRRNLNLIRHRDLHLESKGRRDIYKLVANKDLFEDKKSDGSPKKSSFIKGEKNIDINSQITEHHLQVKMKSVLKWLEKCKQVHVNVSGKEAGRERIATYVNDEVKLAGGRIIQTVDKGNFLQLTANPARPQKQNTAKQSSDEEKSDLSNPTVR